MQMKILSILTANILIFIGKLLNRGSVLPGSVALKIDKNILGKLKMPKTVISVTGSSGKGSTCNLIVDIARNQGKTVVFNDKGSNLITGILTTLLSACNLKGELKQDILVTEIDERYTKLLFKYLKPNYVVITNITRDQPPRHGNYEIVYEEIKKALTKDMHLVLNADDPYTILLSNVYLLNIFKFTGILDIVLHASSKFNPIRLDIVKPASVLYTSNKVLKGILNLYSSLTITKFFS